MSEPGPRPTVAVLEQPDDLGPHVPAWDELAAVAIEPNPFHESWMLLPAWRTLGRPQSMLVVLVHQTDDLVGGAPVLNGLFVLERVPLFRGLPISMLSVWTHRFGPLGTPLLRPGAEFDTMQAFWDWLCRDRRGASIVQFGLHDAEGQFHRVLEDLIRQRGMASYSLDTHARALLRRDPRPGAEWSGAMSSGHRKELRRQRRRLEEAGRLDVRTLDQEGDVAAWIRQFLELEQSGWKGREASALASDARLRAYFEQVARAAHDRGRLMMSGLFLDDRPIAMKCSFLARPGSFAFKIAFDESLGRFSPGVQLELENAATVQKRGDVEWMDSCAVEGHFMIERLWADRRQIATTIVSTSRNRFASALVKSLPALRQAYRWTRPLRRAWR